MTKSFPERFDVDAFAVCFGMGVVSGVVMSYQFGTNWSVFSDKVGNVIGPLLGYEVLTAFFLEASFLGIMLFGWDKVSRKMHFVSTVIVAVGTLISAFWILAANSWMQTPQGYDILDNGLLVPTNWIEIIFNPSFPYRLMHMVTAAYLTTAFSVGGVAAYYLWRKKHVEHARIMFAMAMLMAVFVAPLQLMIGHAHGENTMEYQPIKVAAMEGNWNRGGNKPLYLFGMPDQEEEKTEYGITIPNGASLILTGSRDGEIPGLRDVPAEDRPPVAIVFWSFRVMVAMGMAMIFTGTLPYLLTGTIDGFSNIIFETTSGFTTTGATILNDVEAMPEGILFWRSITHWLGGMGIIVFAIAILPLLGIGGMQLFSAESPGMNTDKLHPRITDTAKRLWLIYLSYTLKFLSPFIMIYIRMTMRSGSIKILKVLGLITLVKFIFRK